MSNKKTNNRQNPQPAAVTAAPAVAESVREIPRELAKFSFDVAKLVIGGVILSGLMKQDIDYYTLAGWGTVVVVTFILIGITLMKYSKPKKNKK